MNQKTRRIVAIYEMATFIGTLINVVGVLVTRWAAIAPVLWLLIAVPVSLATASLIAGISLWRGNPAARRRSMIIQALQVGRFAIDGIGHYSIGLGLSLFVNFGTKPVVMEPAVHLAIGFGVPENGFYLGINVLALTALILLARWRPLEAAPADAALATA